MCAVEVTYPTPERPTNVSVGTHLCMYSFVRFSHCTSFHCTLVFRWTLILCCCLSSVWAAVRMRRNENNVWSCVCSNIRMCAVVVFVLYAWVNCVLEWSKVHLASELCLRNLAWWVGVVVAVVALESMRCSNTDSAYCRLLLARAKYDFVIIYSSKFIMITAPQWDGIGDRALYSRCGKKCCR